VFSPEGEALQVMRLLLLPSAVSSCALESYFAATLSDLKRPLLATFSLFGGIFRPQEGRI
jgi:hypothetical protein